MDKFSRLTNRHVDCLCHSRLRGTLRLIQEGNIYRLDPTANNFALIYEKQLE